MPSEPISPADYHGRFFRRLFNRPVHDNRKTALITDYYPIILIKSWWRRCSGKKNDQRKRCRLNNKFYTNLLGDFEQFFFRLFGDFAQFFRVFFAVFRRFRSGFFFFLRLLGDLAHLGWLRAIMLKLKKGSKSGEKKRVKVVCKPHKIKFCIDKKENNFVTFFRLFFKKNTIITH